MKSQLSPSARGQLDRFSRQYFQLDSDLIFPDGSCLRSDTFQQALVTDLFKSVTSYAPPLRYQLWVLKLLVEKIEQSIQDWDEEGVSDNLMSHLCSLLSSSIPTEATAAQQKSYVTYALSSLGSQDEGPPSITLLETRNLLAAGGTTGLRTWEAALHLGEYVCGNYPHLIRGRAVLELGAGTGYISILCARHLGASYVVATDGSEDVVTNLTDNFKLNGLQDASIIHAKELKWGCPLADGDHSEEAGSKQIDLVLAADVTYDETATAALITTFEDIFDRCPGAKVIIAATLRNSKTYSFFQETCHKKAYNFEEIDFGIRPNKLQTGPFYPDKVPIRICRISRP